MQFIEKSLGPRGKDTDENGATFEDELLGKKDVEPRLVQTAND